jgi:uracil phosphoribosyltransferase
LEGYEALRNAKTQLVEIETPIEKTMQPVVKRKNLCFVPILRAGLGMADGMLELVPGCTCGHIGLYRNEVTHEPVEYYCKLPADISEKDVYLVDPMLATGGSAIDAVKMLKKHGAKRITFICIIAAPEGLKKLHEAHPDSQIYVGSLDRELNENAYICPGLGDAGDRIFGTK